MRGLTRDWIFCQWLGQSYCVAALINLCTCNKSSQRDNYCCCYTNSQYTLFELVRAAESIIFFFLLEPARLLERRINSCFFVKLLVLCAGVSQFRVHSQLINSLNQIVFLDWKKLNGSMTVPSFTVYLFFSSTCCCCCTSGKKDRVCCCCLFGATASICWFSSVVKNLFVGGRNARQAGISQSCIPENPVRPSSIGYILDVHVTIQGSYARCYSTLLLPTNIARYLAS